jgi:AraC-like DNA-binding protein
MRDLGVDPAPFLKTHKLTPELLNARNEHMAYWRYAEVLREAGRACNAPHIGLLLSHAASHILYSEGALGLLLKYCENVGEVLGAITRYYHVVSSGADYQVVVEGDEAFFQREGLVPGLKHDRILQDISLADFVGILRRALGEDWSPRAVLFSCDAPEDPGVYEEWLRAPVQFNAGRQAIQFAASDLKRPIQASKSLLEELLRDLVARTLAQPTISFSRAATQAIDVLLPTGVCCANSVALVFDMHSRTLNRRLKQEGISFCDLLEERRKKHARAYLAHSEMPIADISLAVGYTAPETFTRAFRKWYGMTPNQWRHEFEKRRKARQAEQESSTSFDVRTRRRTPGTAPRT